MGGGLDMKAWQLEDWGLENLHQVELERPKPGPGEVLVQFRAASLNYRDLLVVRGHYNPKFPQPLTPCSDGFGRIVETGAGVDDALLGRSVLTNFAPNWRDGPPQEESLRQTLGGPLTGVLQEYRSFFPDQLAILREPSAMQPEEWATLPCAGVTAWTGLVEHGRLQTGQTVLLIGTGGVSMWALKLAKSLGARVLVLSSSEAKRNQAQSFGADATHSYRDDPKWSGWVKEQTGGQGVDLVLETGGAGTLAQSLKSVKVGGRVSLIGVLSGTREPLNILPLLMKAVTVQGVVVGNRRHLDELISHCVTHQVRPFVEKTYPFHEAVSAFGYLASGHQFGKICIGN